MARCNLCNKDRQLVEGHVWPRFAYKKFVSSTRSGGSFLDLGRSKTTNAQIKMPWFCSICDGQRLGRRENYASQFCDRLLAEPNKKHSYSEELLYFAVSISWRVAKYYMPSVKDQVYRDILKKPSKRWKEYLLEHRSDVLPFSQHLFLVVGDSVDWHKMMGGEVFARKGFILSQVGPLLIVGLLDRAHLSTSDRRIWSRSELFASGGELEVVREWRPGWNITSDLLDVAMKHQHWLIKRVAAAHSKVIR